ncbi:DUF6653 family protein [Roseibium limicola]|nr:DUF6653 family protein [Roseibium limicola]
MRQAQPRLPAGPGPAPMSAGKIGVLGMDNATWRRHASPWSVYTRMATLPLLVAAIWSHSTLGLGPSLALTLGVMIWLWTNPRLFPAPKNTNTWASRATFGERIWLNRAKVPIPSSEETTAIVLSLVTGVGFMATIFGAVFNDLLITLPGLLITYTGKLVFLQRMVGLYETMRDAHPLYRFWTTYPDNDNRRQDIASAN